MHRRAVLFALWLFAVGALAQSPNAIVQKFPDVLGVKVRAQASGKFDFDVTVSSPYDSPNRYADGFRVVGGEGRIYGERKLWHDHAGEQPFTRDLYGVTIPLGVRVVVLQARDQRYGYGGGTVEAVLPGR